MPRQRSVGARAPLPPSASVPLVPANSMPAALASFAVWANSATNRRDLLRSSEFPLRDDVPAFLVLNQLIYRGAARPTDLAEAAEVSTSHISKIVARLEDASLVLRAPDPNDNRAVVVALTKEGRAVGNRIVADIDRYFEELFQDWSDHDRSELGRLIVKLAHSADEASAHALSLASGYDWSSDPAKPSVR